MTTPDSDMPDKLYAVRTRHGLLCSPHRTEPQDTEYIRADLSHKSRDDGAVNAAKEEFSIRVSCALGAFLAKNKYATVKDAQKAAVDFLLLYLGVEPDYYLQFHLGRLPGQALKPPVPVVETAPDARAEKLARALDQVLDDLSQGTMQFPGHGVCRQAWDEAIEALRECGLDGQRGNK